jgi:hypothetical protein
MIQRLNPSPLCSYIEVLAIEKARVTGLKGAPRANSRMSARAFTFSAWSGACQHLPLTVRFSCPSLRGSP